MKVGLEVDDAIVEIVMHLHAWIFQWVLRG